MPSYQGIPSPKVMIIAGEASGDLHGAELVKEITKRIPGVKFFGTGGSLMRAEGVHTLFDIHTMSIMGIAEVLYALPKILGMLWRLYQTMRQTRPQLLILIDYPGLNLILAGMGKRLGCKVLYYISPQVWSWRKQRIAKIRRVVDQMAVILPFEVPFYQENNYHHAHYVGNPTANSITRLTLSTNASRQQPKLPEAATVLGLLPGSRVREITKLLPLFLQVAARMKSQVPNLSCLLLVASERHLPLIKDILAASTSNIEVKLLTRDQLQSLQVCSAALCCSGTATLELSLLKVPMVVAYATGVLNYLIFSRIVSTSWISLCNLVANQEVAKEFFGPRLSEQNIHQELQRILTDDAYRNQILDKMEGICAPLGPQDAAQETSNIACNMLI